MKKERIMKNKPSRCPGSIRPMIYSIASALALMGAASQAQAQFAKTPLYLQNESQITEQPKVKHNIMFFIDEPETFLHPKAQEYGFYCTWSQGEEGGTFK